MGTNLPINMELYETNDYLQFKDLFTLAGLEFNVDASKNEPEGFISAFALEDNNGELVGGAAIVKRKNYFILNDIAVKESLRSQGLGEILLQASLNKIQNLGGRDIYITAKAPKFFEKYGFTYLENEDVPNVFSCLNCKQYGVSCSPKFMIYQK
jgi:amino-acid N-acetyltransferase